MRALSVINYPSLLNLSRRQYDEVWDALAATPELANAAACGHRDESSVRRSVQIPVKNLIDLVGVRPVGLDQMESNSFDLVYSTNILAHLDEMDRWRYVKDASAASSGWTPVHRQC